MSRIIKNFIKFPKTGETHSPLNESSGTAELSKNLERRKKKAEEELRKRYPDIKNCKIDTSSNGKGGEEIALVCTNSDGTEIKSSFKGETIGGDNSASGVTGAATFGNLGDVLAAGVGYLGATKTKDYYTDKEEYYSRPGEDEKSRALQHLGVSDNPDDGTGTTSTSSEGPSYRSGVDSASVKSLLANPQRKGSIASSGELKAPDFSKIGDLGFTDSPEYSAMISSLGLDKKRKKNILKSLTKIGLPDEAGEGGDFIVAVRSPLLIKNEFRRDFTDIFICFNTESERADFYLGSTTPSPIFRFKEDKNSLISLGFIGLANQGGPLIINPTGSSPYVFSKDRDEVFGGCFLQKSNITCQRYKIDDKAFFNNYDPGSTKTGKFGLFFRSANMDGASATGLDATTYGDLVIKNRKDFEDIYSKYGNSVKIYLLELRELPEIEPEKVEEGKSVLKYISRFR